MIILIVKCRIIITNIHLPYTLCTWWQGCHYITCFAYKKGLFTIRNYRPFSSQQQDDYVNDSSTQGSGWSCLRHESSPFLHTRRNFLQFVIIVPFSSQQQDDEVNDSFTQGTRMIVSGTRVIFPPVLWCPGWVGVSGVSLMLMTVVAQWGIDYIGFAL